MPDTTAAGCVFPAWPSLVGPAAPGRTENGRTALQTGPERKQNKVAHTTTFYNNVALGHPFGPPGFC
jgi:hypothetical protein